MYIITHILVFLNKTKNSTHRYAYSQKILLGLVFSCCGDALLNLDMFAYGMGAFGCAQICYSLAFGFQNLRIWIAIVLAIPGITSMFIRQTEKM